MAVEEKKLVRYGIVPTLETIERAKEKGVSPEEYIDDQPIYLDSSENRDGRRRGQYGAYLEDVAIYLPDETRIQIHPIQSEIKEFDKVELYVYPYKRTGTKLIAYVDKDQLDYEKMQTSQEYLQVLGQVISLKRLVDKLNKAEKNGIEGKVCYIGCVALIGGKYKKAARYVGKDEVSAINKIKEAIEKSKRKEQLEYERREYMEYRKKLINKINQKFPSLSNKQLEYIVKYIEEQEQTH